MNMNIFVSGIEKKHLCFGNRQPLKGFGVMSVRVSVHVNQKHVMRRHDHWRFPEKTVLESS